MVPLEDPLPCPMTERSSAGISLQAVQCRVVGEIEQDHVVEVPAVGDVVPTQEPDPVFRLVFADLPGEQSLHVELEEGVPAATDGEVGRQHGHASSSCPRNGRRPVAMRAAAPAATGAAYCRTGPSAGPASPSGAAEASV